VRKEHCMGIRAFNGTPQVCNLSRSVRTCKAICRYTRWISAWLPQKRITRTLSGGLPVADGHVLWCQRTLLGLVNNFLEPLPERSMA